MVIQKAIKNYGVFSFNKIEIYNEWHMELERFFEANYIIIKSNILNQFPHNIVRFNKNNVLENE